MDRFYQSTTPLGVLPAWGGAERPQRGGEARPLGCWRPPRRSISRPSGPVSPPSWPVRVPAINQAAVRARPGDQSAGGVRRIRTHRRRGGGIPPTAAARGGTAAKPPAHGAHPRVWRTRPDRPEALLLRVRRRLVVRAAARRGAPLALRERHSSAPAAIRLAVSTGWMAAGSSPTRGSRLRPLPR